MFGVYQLDSAGSAGQYSALVAAVREATPPVYFAGVFIALVGCIGIFAKEYLRVHKRLFGY
jgi:hypothetical protein